MWRNCKIFSGLSGLGISEIRTTDEIISDIEPGIETGDKAEELLYEEYVDYY